MTGNLAISMRDIARTFWQEPERNGDSAEQRRGIHVLKGISLDIGPGEFVALQGTSGSGKSTLLQIIGLLDQSTSGSYELMGRSVADLDDDELSNLRNRSLGFIFQSFYLIPYATALENVVLPGLYSGTARSVLRKRAQELLDRVGLSDRMDFKPASLSGGQQQRVAMARALVNEPDIILADEPTGQLDSSTSTEIMKLFSDVSALGKTIVLVTHDEAVAERAHRIIHLEDGRIAP